MLQGASDELHRAHLRETELRARLSAAEQQRADWEKHAEECETRAHNFADDCLAAEARVEAARKVVEAAEALMCAEDEVGRVEAMLTDDDDSAAMQAAFAPVVKARTTANAALRAALAGREQQQ